MLFMNQILLEKTSRSIHWEITLFLGIPFSDILANIYFFKVNSRNTKKGMKYVQS